MNLFTFRKMEEDYYTNILMYILAYDNYSLLPLFVDKLIGSVSKEFIYEDVKIELFSKAPSQPEKEFEYIIGIAPFQSYQDKSERLENNLDSIPDAWIFGNNFTLLLEFKIRGTLDDAQLSAHKTKLSNYRGTFKFQWSDVIYSIESIKKNANEIQKFLIGEFILASKQFKSKRRSSGMPKEIIGGCKYDKELHFIITGSKDTDGYTVDIVFPNGNKNRLQDKLPGIQASRKWIAKYIYENHSYLSLKNVDENTIITDLCVKPGRIKNAWDQWRLGSYLEFNRKD